MSLNLFLLQNRTWKLRGVKEFVRGHTVGHQPPRVSPGLPTAGLDSRSPDGQLSGLHPTPRHLHTCPVHTHRPSPSVSKHRLLPVGLCSGRSAHPSLRHYVRPSPTTQGPAWVPSVPWKLLSPPLVPQSLPAPPDGEESPGYCSGESSASLSTSPDRQPWRSAGGQRPPWILWWAPQYSVTYTVSAQETSGKWEPVSSARLLRLLRS